MRRFHPQRGFTILEMLIVVAIIAILSFAVAWPNYKRWVGKSNVRSTIVKLMTLKKAMEKFKMECQGYPKRVFGNNINNLKAIATLCPTGSVCPPYPWGTPSIYPDNRTCDTTSLRNFIPYDITRPACDFTDTTCLAGRQDPHSFNTMFVKFSGGVCGNSDAGNDPGWNYALPEFTFASGGCSGVGGVGVQCKQPVSVPVYCANAIGPSGNIVTVVVNGPGQKDSGPTIQDGSGMIDLNGANLANGCANSAWCMESSPSGSALTSGCCVTLGYRY